jgi:hypothetical protein
MENTNSELVDRIEGHVLSLPVVVDTDGFPEGQTFRMECSGDGSRIKSLNIDTRIDTSGHVNLYFRVMLREKEKGCSPKVTNLYFGLSIHLAIDRYNTTN